MTEAVPAATLSVSDVLLVELVTVLQAEPPLRDRSTLYPARFPSGSVEAVQLTEKFCGDDSDTVIDPGAVGGLLGVLAAEVVQDEYRPSVSKARTR